MTVNGGTLMRTPVAALLFAAAAVETVTPMMDPDGTWHVSGYFIQ
jgi:hypothetical protein